MISETISVDAGAAISELDALAAAADKAAAAFGKLKIPDLGAAGGGGFDKLVAQADAAAAKIEASFARIADAAKGLGDVGASGAAGLGKLADAEDAAAASADRLAKSSAPAADGIKGLGDTTKQSSAWLEEYNATMADTAKLQRDFAASSADSSLAIARAQKVQADARTSLAATSVEQDAAMMQSARATTAAHEKAAAAAEASSHRWKMAGLAGLAIAAYGIDRASQLQAGVTRLYTTAGESKKNLPMISAGILKLAPETATSQAQLLQGAYMAESAGFHGQNALNVLKAGAQGAYAEGAPLGDTINAETSVLNAYGLRGPRAPVSVMDQIIAMVSRGKMTMAGAVSALPSVLPTAAAAGLSFGQVGGALATMTATGVSPDLAAQHLNHTIGSLQNMSGVQVGEIQQLGGDPTKLQKNLGKTGLLGTLGQINDLVTGSMGKSGLVLMKTFNQSASAAADANRMMNAMPDSIKGVAQAYENGKISAKAWNKEVFSGSESAQNKNLLQQFATVENQAKGFNNLLKAGSPAAQTYIAALSKALGGQTGLQTFLQLEGIHAPAAAANTAAVTAAGKHPGADVTGWPDVQKTLKFQLGSADQALQSVATEMGKAFLPLATTGLKDLGNVAKFFAGHETLTKDLGEIAGGALGIKLAKQFSSSLASQVGSIGKALKIPGLANIGKGSGLDAAATSLDGAGTSLKGAADALTGAAEKLGGAGTLGENGVPGGGGREDPVPVAPGEGGKAPGVLGRVLSSPVAGETIPVAGLFGVSDIGRHAEPAAYHRQLTSLQKSNKPTENYPVIGPVKKWVDSWALPLLSGLGAAGVGVGRGVADGTRSSALPGSIPLNAAPGVYARFGASAVPAPAAAAPPAPSAGTMLGLGGHPGTVTVKPKVEPPDTGAISAALAKIGQMAGNIKPVKMPAPDMSALDAAKGKAQAAAQGITQAIESAMHKPVRATPPDLSPYAAAAGAARADGANISAGLAAGIRSEGGAAVAAAQAVAGAVAAAMAAALQTHSPSRVTEKIGKDTDAGLVLGLQGGQDAVTAAANAIGKNVAKASDIASIDATVKKLIADVPKGDSALTKMLEADNKRLDQMANRRSALEQQISDSEQVAKSAVGGASIMNSLTAVNPAGNEPIAPAAVVQGQQYQAASLKQFAAALKKDQALGLNATSLSQIAQAGPDQGLGIAQGIASGGKGAVTQLNAIQKQIQASAASIGNVAGPAMYQAGQDAGKGLASGLKSALGSLDKDMEKIAKSMTTAVEKVAKTTKAAAKKAAASTASDATSAGAAAAASGSATAAKAAAGTGKDPLAGAAASLSASASQLSAAASALNSAAGALKGGGGSGGTAGTGGTPHAPVAAAGGAIVHPVAPAYGGGGGYLPSFGGGGDQHYHQHINVTVQGNVTAERDLLNTIQEQQLTRQNSNWQSGLFLPGRVA